MAVRAAWHTLPVSHPSLPALLVSVSFAQSSYTIHLTDLANIWTEDLTRKDIIRRSIGEDISIDLIDDVDQMGVFLAKLRSALESSHPEHHLTSLSLSLSEKDADTLKLGITCTLPAGLRPLKWPVSLKKAAASSLTTHLTLPLIQARHVKAAESAKLIALLKEKDKAIGKLLDKCEATGVKFDSVFTSLSGRRTVTREMAQAKVKGLGPFSEADFFQKAGNGSDEDDALGNAQQLIEEVFGQDEGLPYALDFESSHEAGLDGWWTKLGNKGAVSIAETKKEKTPKAETPPPQSASGEVDDFEVQDTPPHARSSGRKNARSRKAAADEETESEAGSPSQIPNSYPTPSASKPPPAKKGKLGSIGGKKKQASPAAKSPTPGPPKDEPMPDAGSDTASEPSSPPPPKPATTPKRRLGAIGGKRKTPEVASPSKTDSGDEVVKPAAKAGRRLGQLGKKTGAPSAAKSQEDGVDAGGQPAETEKPKSKAKVEEEKPLETEEERANRRRVELERDLAKKAAAGPAKKKRKF